MGSILATLALKSGLPQQVIKIGLIVLAVVALVGGAGIAKCTYDRNLIANHDSGVNAGVLGAQLNSEHAADTNAAARNEHIAADAANMEGTISNAVSAHPQAAGNSAGPATSAALDELRRRQHPRSVR